MVGKDDTSSWSLAEVSTSQIVREKSSQSEYCRALYKEGTKQKEVPLNQSLALHRFFVR